MHINRKHIRDIENYLPNLHEHFEKWSRVSTVAFENVRISLRIDQCLSALESAHLVWVRQLDVYRRQRAALEIGILKEDVLHPDDLRTILQAGRENGQFPLTEEWYYQFVHIQPIWEDKENLVFTVELPFTDRVTYLRYHLWSWHVASPANYNMPLQVPTDLAYDTEGGHMFIPQDCVGTQPSVCHTGAVFSSEGLTCPRGILTNCSSLRKTCQVTITQSTQQGRLIQ